MNRAAATLFGAIIGLAAWEAVGRTRLLGDSCPPFSARASLSRQSLAYRVVIDAIGQTATEAVMGLAIGSVAGIVLASISALVPLDGGGPRHVCEPRERHSRRGRRGRVRVGDSTGGYTGNGVGTRGRFCRLRRHVRRLCVRAGASIAIYSPFAVRRERSRSCACSFRPRSHRSLMRCVRRHRTRWSARLSASGLRANAVSARSWSRRCRTSRSINCGPRRYSARSYRLSATSRSVLVRGERRCPVRTVMRLLSRGWPFLALLGAWQLWIVAARGCRRSSRPRRWPS